MAVEDWNQSLANITLDDLNRSSLCFEKALKKTNLKLVPTLHRRSFIN
jgi:hypothetical protein